MSQPVEDFAKGDTVHYRPKRGSRWVVSKPWDEVRTWVECWDEQGRARFILPADLVLVKRYDPEDPPARPLMGKQRTRGGTR